jgi:arylsulfatase A-like enzyme/Tfp pilus assembly protein PilF
MVARMTRAAIVMVTAIALTIAGVIVARAVRAARPAANLNLLLVTLDTTRTDRMGAYGGAGGATPAFDRIAAQGVLFEHAVTAAPLTLPAHATLFTAHYPPAHGVRDNGGFVLRADETTLAERLKAAGFQTAGFVGAYVLDRRWGIAQGFDTYVDDFDAVKAQTGALASVERPGNEVVDRALAWLDRTGSSRFFAWVHLYDAHSPYAPPEPYRSRFPNDAYTGEIAFADAQVARLIQFLDTRDLLTRTVVVLAGDHGESLGEHGESTHGFFVYQSVVEVPFAILAPSTGLQKRRVSDVVRGVDLMPTVLDLLNVPLTDNVDGQSLVPMMAGAVHDVGLEAYSESMHPRYHFGWSDLRSLTSGRFKYIDAPRPELYDLARDPQEKENLYDARRAVADRMAAVLRSHRTPAADAAKPAVDIDPDARARLAALGYVGTFAGDTPRDRATAADPKDKIDLFNAITHAREELEKKPDSAAALEMLERVVQRDPQVIDAWLLIGNVQSRRRDFTGALESFRRALALKPDYDLAVMNTANVYRDLGRPRDAIAGLKRLLEIAPDHVTARQQLAQIFLDEGARRLDRGDVGGAEQDIRRALTEQPDIAFAHFNLALAAERRGDLAAAESEYRKEIQQRPASYMAHFNLGKLYEKKGDRAAQLEAYVAAIASNPGFAEGHLFLAKLHLDSRRLDEAIQSARRGLELQPAGEWAPLGHYVLADAFAAQGKRDDSARESAEARRLAARPRSTIKH